MKRIIIFMVMLLICFNAKSAEDGTYVIPEMNNSENWHAPSGKYRYNFPSPLKINEDQSVIFKYAGLGSNYERSFGVNLDATDPTGLPITADLVFDMHSRSSEFIPTTIDIRTLKGPVTINYFFFVSNNSAIYEIKTLREEAKFSVSLDNDGDRVAVGYKEDGTNATIRVYEFDGSQWDQLGSDIE